MPERGTMRDRWQRREPEISPEPALVAALVEAALPGRVVVGHRPVAGGLSNTNLAVELAGPPHRVLLRLYQRDPAQAAKEAALARLLRRHAIPAADFLYFAPDHPEAGRAVAVLEWVEGERLDVVLPRLDSAARGRLGRSVGRTLAAIHAIGFDRPGFFDASLLVREPVDFGRAGLLAWLETCFADGPGAERLGRELTDAVFAFAAREGHRLGAWMTRPVLVHADFNGSNIMVRTAGGGPEVAAVLDWEFAFSGSPAFDFGNLLRPDPGLLPGLADAVATGYTDAGGALPPGWRRIAAIADLTAWADFLTRPGAGDALIADARRLIRATIDAG